MYTRPRRTCRLPRRVGMRNTPTGKKIRTPPQKPRTTSRLPFCQGIHGYSWLTSHDERTVFMARGILVWALLMGLVSLEVCRWRIGVPAPSSCGYSLSGLGVLLWGIGTQHPR